MQLDFGHKNSRRTQADGPGLDGTAPLIIPDHELIRCIGEGAYGKVWLARNVLGGYRAVKAVFRASFTTDEPYEREFRGIQRFEPISRSNDGLVDVLQVGRNDAEGCFYYVMELADPAGSKQERGTEAERAAKTVPDLDAAARLGTYTPRTLRGEIQTRGRLPPGECVTLGLSLSLALGHLHRNGLIHRDIKPANIIFVGGVAKLADIGLVTDLSDARSLVGTEGYIPPEGPNSPQADIYSLGKVLYEISMGKDRKDFPEPATLLGQGQETGLLEELNAIILRACASNPLDRYQTAEELNADLALLNSGKSVKWKRAVERRLDWAKKAIGIGAVLVLLAVAGNLFQRAQFREAQLNLYVASMNLAQRDWEKANISRLNETLSKTEKYFDKGFEWFYWQRQLHLDLKTLRGHAAQVRTVAFSPNGRHLVSGGEDKSGRVWDVASGKLLFILEGHQGAVVSVAYFPDGQQILTGSHDNTARIWNASDGRHILQIPHTGLVFAGAVAPDGKTIVTGSRRTNSRAELSIQMWDAFSGQLMQTLSDGQGAHGTCSIAYLADGRRIAAITDQFALTVWDAETGCELFVSRPIGELYSLALAPDGQRFATGTGRETAIWDAITGEKLFVLEGATQRGVWAAAFSSDGTILITGGGDQQIIVWNAAERKELFRLTGHQGTIESVAVSPDGSQIASASADGSIKLWAADALPNPRTFPEKTKQINMLAISPDGTKVASATWDRKAQIWDVATGGQVLNLAGSSNEVTHLAFSPDGRRIATGNGWHGPYTHDPVRLWDCSTGTELLSVEGRGFVAFSPEGHRILTASGRNSATIWDSATGKELVVFAGHADWVQCGAFSPDGRRIASACGNRSDSSSGRTVKLWDAESGRELLSINRYPPENDISSCLAFSPDGERIAFAGNDRIPRVWDAHTGRELLALRGHTGAVGGIAYSPDGKRLITFSQDRTARLWDALTGHELLSLEAHTQMVKAGGFFPDGQRIATASLDGTIKIWEAASPRQVAAWQAEEAKFSLERSEIR